MRWRKNSCLLRGRLPTHKNVSWRVTTPATDGADPPNPCQQLAGTTARSVLHRRQPAPRPGLLAWRSVEFRRSCWAAVKMFIPAARNPATVLIQARCSHELSQWVKMAALGFVIPSGNYVNRSSHLLLSKPPTNQGLCQSQRDGSWDCRTNERTGLHLPHRCLLLSLTPILHHLLVIWGLCSHPLPWQ